MRGRTASATTAQERPDRSPKIPKPNDPRGVAVYDGQRFAGGVVPDDGKHHLFNAGGRWLGTFTTRLVAMRALPLGGGVS